MQQRHIKAQGGNRYGKVPRYTKIREEKTTENSKREETGKAGKEKGLKKEGGDDAIPFGGNREIPTLRRDCDMPIFMMFGKYPTDALKKVSSKRTQKAVEIIKKNGGKVISMYAVLGEHDLVLTLDFPDAEKALLTSVTLHALTGISFVTSPVVDVEQFDTLVSEITDM